MSEELKRVEAVLDEKVRPSLRSHGGAIEVDRLENRVLYVKLLGQCAGCPSADLTHGDAGGGGAGEGAAGPGGEGLRGAERQRRAVGAGEKAFAGPPSVKKADVPLQSVKKAPCA